MKPVPHVQDMLNINDVFWTIQGEGTNAGRRALFVRMPFCNLACSWCDTTFDTFKEWSEMEFLLFAQQETARLAVITGGEPSMNKHTPKIIELLKSLNFEIAMESNGCFPPPDGIDYLTISPKRDSSPRYFIHPKAIEKAYEYKYVVDKGFDFSVVEWHKGGRLFLSPEFTDFKENIDKIVSYIGKNPHWRVSLQTHKFMGVA